MMQEINWFNELFLSTEMWGYFGVLAVVAISVLVIKREKGLGIFFLIVQFLLIAQYLSLANYEVYLWHVIILILGVMVCVFRLISK